MGSTVRWALVAAVVALAGCKDLGVRGSANVPLNIARTRPVQFWAYQAVNPAGQRRAYEGRTGDQFTLGDQSFIVQFPDLAGSPALLRPAGNVKGAVAYAPAWERPPYRELYISPAPGRLQVAPEIWK